EVEVVAVLVRPVRAAPQRVIVGHRVDLTLVRAKECPVRLHIRADHGESAPLPGRLVATPAAAGVERSIEAATGAIRRRILDGQASDVEAPVDHDVLRATLTVELHVAAGAWEQLVVVL